MTAAAAGAAGGGEGKKETIGFLGLGYMGNGMVRRLINHGHPVVVWNRTPSKCQQLLAEFSPEQVTIAQSPKDVVTQADTLTFAMLSTPAACEEVYHAPDGILAGISKGKQLVDCATLTPTDMQKFEKEVHARGGLFLEAPVSGSKVPAETGTLIFLTAGDKDTYTHAQPALDAMGKASFFLGDKAGKGTEMKLIVNKMLMEMMSSLSEGLALAGKANLSQKDMIEVLSLGAMANPMFALKGPKILADEHTPNFPLKHAQKDLAFVINLAKELGVSVPTAETANMLYVKALEAGEGEKDFSAVARVMGK